MGPLAFAVPATTDSDEKQRFVVGTTGGSWGRLTRAVPFCIILRGPNRYFEALRWSAYEVARYQVLGFNEETTEREFRAEGRQT